MYILTFILFLNSVLFSEEIDFSIEKIELEPGSEIIDLSKSNFDEKVENLKSVMQMSNKIILYFQDYGINVYQIISIKEDSIKLELFDSSWYNKTTRLTSYGSTGSKPLFFTSNDNNADKHSQIETFSINDIIAIQIKQNNSFRFLIFPLLIAVVLMEVLGI